MTQAHQHRQGGTTTHPGKAASIAANANAHAPIAAGIACADDAKEYPVVKMCIIYTSPQVAGNATVAAAEAIAGTAAVTIN
jgi:hypothetical protein